MRWVGSFAAVLILVLLVAIWRLMQGPIELNWLAPYAVAAFERSDIGLQVAVSGMRLGIDRNTHQLDLRAQDVRLSLPDGEPVANFQEMAMRFGVGPLLGGQVVPAQIVVEGPVLHLKRDAAGRISAQIGAGDPDAAAIGPLLLEQLAKPAERNVTREALQRVRIRNATIILDDLRTGQTWRADRVDMAAERGPQGVHGDLSLALPIGASRPELHMSYRYHAAERLLDLDLAVDGVLPAAIPPLIPELVQLQHVAAPVSGTLRTRIDVAKGAAQGSRLDLALGKGRLHSTWLPEGSVEVEKGELHATYAPENDEIRVESFALDLDGGTRLQVTGSLGGVTPELLAAAADARPAGLVRGDFSGALKHVPAARLGQLWPAALSPGGRRWTLANIRDGMLDEASIELVADLDPVAHTVSVLNAEGRLSYRDLTVNYFEGLPPARKVGGTATFTGDRLDFVPTEGVLKGLTINGGTLQLTQLDEPIEWLTIDLALTGPLSDALDVIDSKPLHYARAVGIDPAQVAGRTETQLSFRFPLINDLKLEAIEYGAKATITGAAIDKIALDRGIRDGNLTLDLGRTGANLRGTARFDGIPAKLDANIYFDAKKGPNALYRVGMTLDDDAQRRLGIDVAPERLSGPVGLDASYAEFAGNRSEAIAVLDLRDAAVAIAEAGWSKPPGQHATARIVVDLDRDRITRLRQIELGMPGLNGQMTALFDAAGKQLERIDISRLTIGENDVTGTLSRLAGGGWRADIGAGRIDARHLLKHATDGAPSAAPAPPLAVNARIGRLVLGPQRELHDVGVELLRSNGSWQSGRVGARHVGGQQMSLQFGEGGSRRLVFQSDDLGATLQLLDIADNVAGGRVTLDGQFSDEGGQRVLRARVEGHDYTLNRASLPARLLALPSLTGLASALTGSGLPFSTLRGDLVYRGSQISIEQLLAYGEALGITAKGWVDIGREQLELQGTVAPAYALNSIIGHVPIIGPLLGGGSQGLFAANYRLSGSTGDPDIAVNPLSALAPGVLRQLFAPLVGFPPPQPEQAVKE